MPIHVILGKPGSGKSLYATDRLIKELVESKRNIVTNLPIRPERLNEYLQKRYPAVDLRMAQRLRILTDEEMSKFWSIRGPAKLDRECPPDLQPFVFTFTAGLAGDAARLELARFDAEQGKYREQIATRDDEQKEWLEHAGDTEGREGVAYFLDEAHIAFNARDWAQIGRGALHYLSQHRKLGDVVWPITQACGNLDKQFRSVAEDFTVLRNEYTAKFGVFKGRGRFVRRTYLSEPSGNAEPFETASFELDPEGVASCYDTAKGIGVHGNKADIGRRAKGIPIWTVVPAFMALALLCVFIPWMLGKGVAKVATKSPLNAASSVAAKMVPGGAAAPPEVPKPVAPAPVVVASVVPAKPSAYSGVTVSGYSVGNGKARVNLSDGSVLESGDGILASIAKTSVTLVDGTVIPMRAGRVDAARAWKPAAPPTQTAVAANPVPVSGVSTAEEVRSRLTMPKGAGKMPAAFASKQSPGRGAVTVR